MVKKTNQLKKLTDDYINGVVDDDGNKYFPTFKELSVRYDMDLKVIREFIESDPDFQKEREININSLKNEIVISSPEGLVKHIDSVLMNFVDLGEETMSALKYQLLSAIQDGNAKDADSWSKVIERYMNMMNNMRREKQMELIKKDQAKYSEEDSSVTKNLLVLVEQVIENKMKNSDVIDADYDYEE